MPRRELEHSQDPVRGQPVCSQHHAKTNFREARAYGSWLGPVSQPQGSCLYSTPWCLYSTWCASEVVLCTWCTKTTCMVAGTTRQRRARRKVPGATRQRRARRDACGMVASGLAGTHSDGSWSACCPLQRRRIGTRISCARSASDGPRCTARTSVLCPAHFAAGHASRPTPPNHPTLTKKGWKTRG